MRHALSAGLMLIFSLLGPNSGGAQPMTTSTPTTKILAIGTINSGVREQPGSKGISLSLPLPVSLA
jgi:hypothetical protein